MTNVATGPVIAAGSYDDVAGKVSAFLQAARSAAADGLTWGEFGALLVALLRISIQALDVMQNLTGAEKKEIAVHAVATLFDLVADKCVPWTMAPLWMVARPAVRSLVLALAGGAIETLLPMIRSR
jgi:hypothetical protein